MPEPKAPAWLRESFAEGVAKLAPPRPIPAYRGALGVCWLAQFDERRRACTGRLERAHLVPRQRVENALGALLPGVCIDFSAEDRIDLTLLAAWDPRNGIVACEGMHRRFDSHATPPLTVPRDALPGHLTDWAEDYGLEHLLDDRFPR
jgi:hypothetical protein